MTTTIDTNVLVYASDAGAAEQPHAEALLRHLAAGPDLVVVMWPPLMGYLRTVTHPSLCQSPLPFEAPQAHVHGPLAPPYSHPDVATAEFLPAFGPVTSNSDPLRHILPDAHPCTLKR